MRRLALLAPALLALTVAGCSTGHKTPYRTLSRPPLPAGVLAPNCGSKPARHVMGACLPHALPKFNNALHGNTGITGPDFSNNDPVYGNSAWSAIAARNRFVYLKSIEGTGFYDSTAASMAAQAKAHGIPVGGYDFLHVCWDSAAAEASFFVRALHAQGLLGPGTLPPAADAEYGSGACGGRAWMDTWVATVHAETGIWPIVYTGAWWWQPNLGSYWPGNSLSWISGYGVNYPYMPSGRSELDIWQFSDHSFNGATSVDMSLWWQSTTAFNTFAHVGPPAPPPDPHHYLRFPSAFKYYPGGRRGGPFDSPWGKLDERGVVMSYDGAIAQPSNRYKNYIGLLRAELGYLANRIAYLACWDHDHAAQSQFVPCHWDQNDWGWRFQELIHRSQGKRVNATFLTYDTPTLAQEDVVTTGAEPGGEANGWGPHTERIIRDSNGNLWTTTYAFNTTGVNTYDQTHPVWTLWKRTAGGTTWSAITTGVTMDTGQPAQVLLAPNGTTVYVVTISAYDSAALGAPQVWDSVSNTTQTVPGTWLEGTHLQNTGVTYFSAVIDPSGQLLVWETVPCTYFTPLSGTVTCTSTNVPGTYYWTYRDIGGTWHEQQWISNYRQGFNFLFPNGTSSLRVTGQRDITEAEALAAGSYSGEAHPCNSSYCWDQELMQTWTAWGTQPGLSPQIVRAATDTSGYTGNHYEPVEDAYVDTSGRMHALLSVIDSSSSGAYQNHHTLIQSGGSITDVQFPAGIPYANLARITQDTHGNYWLYSVGPGSDGHHCTAYIAGSASGDTDGTNLGSVTVIPFAGSYDCSAEIRNFDVNPRGGTPLADYIDGAIAADDGGTWVHYRINLPTSGAPDENPTASFTALAPTPTASFNAAASNDPDGTITSYSWSFGDGGTGTGVSPTHTYAGPGTYAVTLTVTDSSSLTATSTQSVVVSDEAPTSTFSSSTSGLGASFNGSASNDPDGTISSYAWTYGDGGTGSGATPTHTYAAAGTYTVTLTVTDSGSQTATSTQSLTVSSGGGPPPPPPPPPAPCSCGCRRAACTGGGGGVLGHPLTIINGTPLCDAIAGRRYTNRLLATGGTPPYLWRVAPNGAGPPSGMSITPNGILSGVPPLAGALGVPGWSRIDVQAIDSTNQTVTRQLWLTVLPDWAAVAARGNCTR